MLIDLCKLFFIFIFIFRVLLTSVFMTLVNDFKI